ncbi:hypothetical protein D3C72_1762920 [compost metagenome]
MVLHPHEVADGVVHIALGVCAHGVAVAWMVEPRVEGVECGGRGRRQAFAACQLTEVLAPVGPDQPVERVVDIVVARLDALVPEVDGLLRIVADVSDVADRVIGVVLVLHLLAWPGGVDVLRIVIREVHRLAPG